MKYTLPEESKRGLPVRSLKKGRRYPEALKATAGMNFSAGIWYFVHRCGDRFSPAQHLNSLSIEEAVEFLYRLGVKALSFHYPHEYSDENAETINTLLQERGMRVLSIAGNTFLDIVFKYGGPSSHIRDVRKLALDLNKKAQELCLKAGARFQTDWAGRDGFELHFLYDTESQWEWTVEAYAEVLLSVKGKVGWAIEFKPYDPTEQSVIKNIDSALLMCREVEERIKSRLELELRRELPASTSQKEFHSALSRAFAPYGKKMGVNIEDAHVYLAGQKVSDAVRKALSEDRLFLRHENDCEGRIDNDLIFGSVHFWDALEACYYQLEYDYDEKGGFHEPDLFPQRDDPLKAYIQSVNSINFFYALARKLTSKYRARLEKTKALKQASSAHELLTDLLSEGIDYKKIPPGLADEYRREIGKPFGF